MGKYKMIMKFLISGGSTTVLDYTIYRILMSISCPALISKFFSMLCAIICSFVINKKWTFQHSEKTDSKLIVRYLIAQLINIVTNTSVNTIVYNHTNMINIAFVFATICAMIVNFILQKKFVFGTENKIN